MGAKQVADQLCQYFGGPYVAASHTYSTPQVTVAGLGGPIFRRGVPKRDDHATDFGMTQAGIQAGCQSLIILERGKEKRIAVAGAVSGVKLITWSVRMHFFFRAEFAYGEDLQDICYDLLDAIRAHIEADRTCGTGGFEAGYGVGFQVGEGGEPWLSWHISPVDNTAKDLSKGYMLLEFDADQYIQA
jgi:hypothetical protein